jgi:hypothetical protein
MEDWVDASECTFEALRESLATAEKQLSTAQASHQEDMRKVKALVNAYPIDGHFMSSTAIRRFEFAFEAVRVLLKGVESK